ncbi:hypothetical protein OG799_07060 [Micromonospora sp. NBC_00898]|uniref:hypothetical protein n=1 Tax=Micromonospora sp. NBC_00898 TaxID=2975981 RepID=UPI0038655839|nr:hypothetical protein OG799_07060 [Micromonospora sp. NBC_00898]
MIWELSLFCSSLLQATIPTPANAMIRVEASIRVGGNDIGGTPLEGYNVDSIPFD